MNTKDLKYLFEAYNSMYENYDEEHSEKIKEQVEKLASGILNLISQIDESLNYEVFAKAISKVLEEYGTHNYKPFLKELKNNLNLNDEQSAQLTTEASKKVNPWAVCGKIKKPSKKERCVKDVKKSAKKYKKQITSEPVKSNK